CARGYSGSWIPVEYFEVW
nr:immunoglobulin heavy chain junction region [Macaca mulatta]MOW75232.1 immunoglobulin heavy chain junction region [Macaca mulatta]MOW76168.1 immunoglobulin heavy chain junction region [Macaca mulatta]MOW76948.1 immunoglobulin heavy chain junction region [Macaca mulatta]MOW78190.1 immunoglobulin heavy chain junction region [Macaca mulatta]